MLCTLLQGQGIQIEPVFFGLHRTAGGTWQGASDPVSFAGWGVQGQLSRGHWNLEAVFINSRFFNLENLPNRFSPEQGFSWIPATGDKGEGFNTDYSSMRITYQTEKFEVYAGKFSQSWGPGLHSMTISSKPPTYPQIGFEWQLGKRFRFRYQHGDLF
ncbi:MAG: hypothetical protein JSW54_04220, partial [Fidelibacterota bacterium]